jgi:hypothetical protein
VRQEVNRFKYFIFSDLRKSKGLISFKKPGLREALGRAKHCSKEMAGRGKSGMVSAYQPLNKTLAEMRS